MRIAGIAATLLCLLPSALAAQAKCGVQRWPVKIWSDRDSAKVDTVPIPITIAELVQLPRPDGQWPNSNRVGDLELKTFLVRGRMMDARPQDDDSDIHLVLHDLEIENATIVTEIPHPGCTANERLARLYDDARKALRTVPRDGIVEVMGIGFFDTLHGQRGMSPNGLEIHPVLRLRVVTPPPRISPPGRRDSIRTDSARLSDSVWVNTSSGVYHCPGTRWFGRTIRGRFTTEREAMQSGARPAGGKRCVGWD